MSYYPPPVPGSPPPLPVQTFSYATPMRSGRPGILTAVGVVSVCLAGFGLLASAGGVVSALVFSTLARTPVVATPAPGMGVPSVRGGITTVTSGANGAGSYVVSNGDSVDATAGAAMLAGFESRRSLSDGQERQLKALLSQAGQKIFPGDAKQWPRLVVRNNISESGSIPGVGGGGSTYFIVGTGRIEVYDDHAVFRPDGSAETVSVSKTADEDSSVDQTPGTSVASGTNGMTPVGTASSGGGAVTFGTGAAPPAPMTVFNGSAFSKGTMLVSAGENLLSLGVAVILLVAGILTLRDSRKAAKWHWIYLFAKIPLVILASVTGMLMMRNTMASLPTGMPGGPNWFSMIMMIGAVFGLAIGLAYPIALIFILRSRDVREYYGAVTE